ncbi:hypothetical protein [Motilibacter aurantiacus]|uniref:hypothetical protein n=1 Tax=Motilibacter aurantiacus TaxID=2714955 RepID=UPI00140CECF4|nr:hypothetical protein [Motilibacter aurantiacus]NHC44773.1 hypothetical protein [Motilibacter aurantiacus]
MAQESPQVPVGDGWGVLSTLLTGVFLFGGLGWLGDRLLGTAFLLPVGMIGGSALSIVTIYARYNRAPGPPDPP